VCHLVAKKPTSQQHINIVKLLSAKGVHRSGIDLEHPSLLEVKELEKTKWSHLDTKKLSQEIMAKRQSCAKGWYWPLSPSKLLDKFNFLDTQVGQIWWLEIITKIMHNHYQFSKFPTLAFKGQIWPLWPLNFLLLFCIWLIGLKLGNS